MNIVGHISSCAYYFGQLFMILEKAKALFQRTVSRVRYSLLNNCFRRRNLSKEKNGFDTAMKQK